MLKIIPKRLLPQILALLFAAAATGSACAAEIVLKSGQTVKCAGIWEADGLVYCDMHGLAVGYSKERIDRIINNDHSHQQSSFKRSVGKNTYTSNPDTSRWEKKYNLQITGGTVKKAGEHYYISHRHTDYKVVGRIKLGEGLVGIKIDTSGTVTDNGLEKTIEITGGLSLHEKKQEQEQEQKKVRAGEALFPPYTNELYGKNPVRIRNPNNFSVKTGLRSGRSGKDFSVSANGVRTVYVPNGQYQIYFIYSDRPESLFQGDSFQLNDSGIEIQIVMVVDGNYGIRQVK